MYHSTDKNTSNIVMHRPQSATCRTEEELMQKSARALASATDPVEKLRLLCLSRGTCGIMSLGRIFRSMGDDGNNQLDKEKFLNAIKISGLELSHTDAEELFSLFDRDQSGSVNLDDFISKIRPPMSESRRDIVEQVFHKLVMLDKSGDGTISVRAIRAMYAPTAHSMYITGEETADVILNKFLSNFQAQDADDGKVTPEEFMNYYSGVSVSIENDCNFDLMMRQAFKL